MAGIVPGRRYLNGGISSSLGLGSGLSGASKTTAARSPAVAPASRTPPCLSASLPARSANWLNAAISSRACFWSAGLRIGYGTSWPDGEAGSGRAYWGG